MRIQGPFDLQFSFSIQRIDDGDGIRYHRSRLDISRTHLPLISTPPMSITTRINPNTLFESMSSTIHEVGHGLYEQGLDQRWAGTPYGAARSWAFMNRNRDYGKIGPMLPFWEANYLSFMPCFHPEIS